MSSRIDFIMTTWLVFACKTSYAPELAEIIWRRGEQVLAFVDNLGGSVGMQGIDTVGLDAIPGYLPSCVVIAPTTPGHRFAALALARSVGCDDFPALVDPTAVIARTAALNEGTTVNAGAILGARSQVGRFVCINRSASVGHDANIGDFVSLGPGCVLGGHVAVGAGTFVGVGAICAPQVSIGTNATIGAGAVVLRDVPNCAVVVGNPGRILRVDETGYGGVNVPMR